MNVSNFAVVRVSHEDAQDLEDGLWVADYIGVGPTFHAPYVDIDKEIMASPACRVRTRGADWYVVRVRVAAGIAEPCGRCYRL